MKKASLNFLLLFITLNLTSSHMNAQTGEVNYDESKVPPYTLPDPLQTANGRRITTEEEWLQYQRPRMLQLFADNVYGRMPGNPKDEHFEVTSVDSSALNGKAVRKQITIYFTEDASSPSMHVLLYLPKSAKGPVAVFTGLNFHGNQAVDADKGIDLPTGWIDNEEDKHITGFHATEASRGTDSSRWPLREIIDNGYGVATAYYGDLEPDYPEGWKTGIRTTLKKELGIKENEWGAIGAWAWGLSRMMDYLETDSAVNAQQVVITGHSRLGKTALWAAANDTRFAIVVSNDSGEGGAALSKRFFGETIEKINNAFPHWFSPSYKKYNGHAELLPVDQHILLSLMAPRPLYVASAEDDLWADPKGEFLSAKNAGPVYALFGKKGLGVDSMPPVNSPVGETIRYHIRTGKHDITLYDWQQYIDFANRQLRQTKEE